MTDTLESRMEANRERLEKMEALLAINKTKKKKERTMTWDFPLLGFGLFVSFGILKIIETIADLLQYPLREYPYFAACAAAGVIGMFYAHHVLDKKKTPTTIKTPSEAP